MIDWCNQNQGFAMVLLTLVYVLATIAICIFNYKSAKATSEQTKELKRQFDEQNRAFITVTMQKIKNGLISLCIENHGNKIAKNVSVKINDDFINILQDNIPKKSLHGLMNSKFMVGIGQKWYACLGSCLVLQDLSSETMQIKISYNDDKNDYEEEVIIDFGQYNWILLNDSEITEIRDDIKKQAKSFEKIENSIKKIANAMEKE